MLWPLVWSFAMVGAKASSGRVGREVTHRRESDQCVTVGDQATQEQTIFDMKICEDISG